MIYDITTIGPKAHYEDYKKNGKIYVKLLQPNEDWVLLDHKLVDANYDQAFQHIIKNKYESSTEKSFVIVFGNKDKTDKLFFVKMSLNCYLALLKLKKDENELKIQTSAELDGDNSNIETLENFSSMSVNGKSIKNITEDYMKKENFNWLKYISRHSESCVRKR